MKKIKVFLKKKRVGFYIAILTMLMTVYSFASYMFAANDSYGYDKILIVLYLGVIILNIVFLVKDFFDAGSIVTGIATGLTFGAFIKVRFTYFATGVMGISQDGISSGIITALLSLLLIVVINSIGAFFMRENRSEDEKTKF